MVDLRKYEKEIDDILSSLDELKSGNFYENNKPGYPSAATIAKNIEEMFRELLKKIAGNEPGFLKEFFNVDVEK